MPDPCMGAVTVVPVRPMMPVASVPMPTMPVASVPMPTMPVGGRGIKG